VPKSVSKLKYKLQFLDLSLNSIEKLPQAITKLTYLEEFYIKVIITYYSLFLKLVK
jgi:Leucine-rich repeat (LRR) protein